MDELIPGTFVDVLSKNTFGLSVMCLGRILQLGKDWSLIATAEGAKEWQTELLRPAVTPPNFVPQWCRAPQGIRICWRDKDGKPVDEPVQV